MNDPTMICADGGNVMSGIICFALQKLSTRTGCGDTPPLDNFRVAIYSIVKGRD